DAFEKQGFYYGPLQKNIYTQELELLAKCLLKYDNDIKFSSVHDPISNKKVLHAIVNDLNINVSALLSKANFSHFNFNIEDSALFLSKYFLNNSTYQSNTDLTKAENSVLENYTGNGYYDINCF
ncbi:MAG TPA: hypothetical protein PLD88_11325, partial [Candidatus Berkiella sp.]|nr:hypothetical protein [Candidatus Berkiella sp.]